MFSNQFCSLFSPGMLKEVKEDHFSLSGQTLKSNTAVLFWLFNLKQTYKSNAAPDQCTKVKLWVIEIASI